MMWKTIGFSVLVTVAVVAAIAYQDQPSTSLPVLPAKSASRVSNRVYAVGRIEGVTEQIELRPSILGRVEAVLVTAGMQVEAGQVLLRLDDREATHQLALASAELLSERSQLQRLLNGPTSYELDEARALYDAVVARLQNAESTWERVTHLRQANAIPVQQADDQRAELARTQAEVAAAKARLDNLAAQPRADDVSIAEARVAAAEARYEAAATRLDHTRLKAPISGQILRVNVDVGEEIGAVSSEPPITMADVSRFTVRAFVEELDAPGFKTEWRPSSRPMAFQARSSTAAWSA